MATVKGKGYTTSTVIDDNATLANNARAAGDYDNSTNLALYGVAYITVQYDGGPPSVGDDIGHLYVLPGDGAGTEVFPDGGDAAIGTDDTPQDLFYVGTFRSINPSTTVDEVLAIPNIPLVPDTNRFVLVNVSGQIFDSTWQLDLKPLAVDVV